MSTETLLTEIRDELKGIRQALMVQPARAAPADVPLYRFPKAKAGQPVKRNDVWYREALIENVNNPERARWRDETLAHLNAVLAMDGLPPYQAPGGGPSPDDIPL